MNKKILIFGIDSFTGHHLEAHFSSLGYEICGTTVLSNRNHTYCDITRPEQTAKVLAEISPEYVINLAAISFVGHGNPEDFYRINVIGSQNILEAAAGLSLRPKKILLPSSAAVYGNIGGVLDESIVPSPVNHYGISKYSMELIARNYSDKLNIIIPRPFNYTGKMQTETFVIPKIFNAFSRGEKCLRLGNINTVREYNDVRMVAHAYAELLTCPYSSESVNICSGRGYSLKEVIACCEGIFGYKIEVETDERFVRKNEIDSLIGSPAKLKSMIGDYKSYTLEEMLTGMMS